MKCLQICLAALSAASLHSSTPAQTHGQGGWTPKNVILIVLDDVGVETLACYNPPVPTVPTPRLSALAATGVRFTRAYANPVCSTTRATIMTGRYSFRTGMGYLASAQDEGFEDYSLPLTEQTIPEMLTGPVQPPEPYTSGAFGKWHLAGSGDLMHPIDQGFDLFVGSIENTGGHFNWDKIVADSSCAVSTHIGQPYSSCTGTYNETTFSASVIRQEASAWISSVPEPFFAYVCFNPPHHPWQVPPYSLLSPATLASFNHADYPEGEPQSNPAGNRKAYGWMLEAIDTEIGRLVDNIPAGKLARTTILVVADNGTPGQVIDPYYNGLHAKGSVYEQGVNVPLIANGNNVHAGGLTCSGLVNTVDIWRTVIALAGLPAPSGFPDPFDGKSFKHMLANPSAASNRTQAFSQVFPNGSYDPVPYLDPLTGLDPCNEPNVPPELSSIKPGHKRAMTDGRYKYVRMFNSSPPFQQAFDLQTDPLETTDLWLQWAWPFDADACDVTPSSLITGQTEVWALRNAMVALSAP